MHRLLTLLLFGVVLAPAFASADEQTPTDHLAVAVAGAPVCVQAQTLRLVGPEASESSSWLSLPRLLVQPRARFTTRRYTVGRALPPLTIRGGALEFPLGGTLAYAGEWGPPGSRQRISVYCPGGVGGSWLYDGRCMGMSHRGYGGGQAFRIVPLCR